MICQFKPGVSDQIVQILSSGPREAKRIQRSFKSPITIQAVYKELRNLQREGVIIKIKKYYCLNLSWINQVEGLIQRAKKAQFSDILFDSSKSPYLSTTKWKFTSLEQADGSWIQLMVYLLQFQTELQVFQFHPYLWFVIRSAGEEARLMQVFSQKKHSCLMIVGNDTKLNRLLGEAYKKRDVTISFSCSPFHGLPFHITVIGEYVIKVSLNRDLSERLSNLFREDMKGVGVSLDTLMRIKSLKGLITVTIKRDPKLSKRYTRIFKTFFGIAEKLR